ncbi:MAG TPA: hypothetical protein VL400_21575 [Polyangiaceae bacterium]|nr:hypothetical protein [Polyangiaceae bacterium]
MGEGWGTGIRRRQLFGALGVLAWPASARAGEIPSIPLAVAVARSAPERDDGVVDAAFIARELDRANEIFGEHGIRFHEADARRGLASTRAELTTRADRDALAAELVPHRVSVFFVRSLRDVDDPSLFRMGVTWRKLSDLRKRYVIVAASARETTLAHELGHFLGNEHSYVRNNLMSYLRDDESKRPRIFLDDKQADRARRTAQSLFATGELAS